MEERGKGGGIERRKTEETVDGELREGRGEWKWTGTEVGQAARPNIRGRERL